MRLLLIRIAKDIEYLFLKVIFLWPSECSNFPKTNNRFEYGIGMRKQLCLQNLPIWATQVDKDFIDVIDR